MSRDVVTSCRDILCHHISWQNESIQVNQSETPKSHFTTWLPWHLTYDLGLDIIRVNPYTKFWVRTSTVQPRESWQMHTQTDRRDRFYTLDRWRRREKVPSFQTDQDHVQYIVTCQAHPVLVKSGSSVRSVSFLNFYRSTSEWTKGSLTPCLVAARSPGWICWRPHLAGTRQYINTCCLLAFFRHNVFSRESLSWLLVGILVEYLLYVLKLSLNQNLFFFNDAICSYSLLK